MAILDTLTGKGAEEPKKKAAPKKKTTASAKKADPVVREKSGLHIENVIQRPRITEKAAISADDNNAYAFMVDPRATKSDVAAAIKKVYDVVPTRVNMVNTKPKQVRRGGRLGQKSGFKKAIVFLKKGDKIEFV
jgi:large subunit ribosomal protein L23